MRYVLLALPLLALAACAPADEQYCRSMGVAGTNEYGNCMDYYHAQEAAFRADRVFCDSEADQTYPQTLYDTGHYEHIMGGFGPYGRYYGAETVRVWPDRQHNAQVDALRMRIIEPCMQARGWNSGATWQAGRHAVSKKPRKSAPVGTLPWLR